MPVGITGRFRAHSVVVLVSLLALSMVWFLWRSPHAENNRLPPPPPEAEKHISPPPPPDHPDAQLPSQKGLDLPVMTFLRQAIHVNVAKLVSLLLTYTPDHREVDKTIEAIGEIRTKMLRQQVANDREIRSLLTPD